MAADLAGTGLIAMAIAGAAGADGEGEAAGDVSEPFVQKLDGTVVRFEMIPVPPGTVMIGDREVSVAPFWIGRTELTWDAFDVYMFGLDEPAGGAADATARPSKPYISMDRGFGHAGFPAISVSYHSAQSFCRWLSVKTGRRYRLPTEAEWRHACALSGVDAESLDEHAWHSGNASFKTHEVASRRADAGGLHDLLGNASEWCTGADGAPVTMGGNYRSDAEELACGARVPPSASWNASDPQIPKSVWWLADAGFIGFRLVCEPGPFAKEPAPTP